MIRLNKLLKKIEWTKDDIIQNQEDISIEQMNRINKMTLDKVKNKNRKKLSLKYIVAILGISSVFFVGATNIIKIEDIFRNIFREDISNINNLGQILQLSNKSNNITLNMEGVVSDNNNMHIVFNLKNEKNFIEDSKIKFENIDIITDGKEENTLGKIKRTKLNILESSSEYKRLHLEISNYKDLSSKQIGFILEDLIEYKEQMTSSSIDLQNYLTLFHQEELIKNKDDRVIENIFIPKYLIPYKNLNIKLYENKNLMIDSIGILEGKLHIRTKASDDILLIIDDSDNIIRPLYQFREMDSGYFVYDIKDVFSIKELNLAIESEEELNKINGTWEVNFDNQYKEDNMYVLNEQVNIEGLKDVVLTNISIKVKCGILNNKIFNTLKINLLDDTVITVDTEPVIDTNRNDIVERIYLFKAPINIQDVESISIDNNIIPISFFKASDL